MLKANVAICAVASDHVDYDKANKYCAAHFWYALQPAASPTALIAYLKACREGMYLWQHAIISLKHCLLELIVHRSQPGTHKDQAIRQRQVAQHCELVGAII